MIDKKELLSKLMWKFNCDDCTGECDYCVIDAIRFIEEVPTVDAVEVVRCKDCKYWGGSKYSNSHETDFVCEYWESDGLMWNDFCSMGERKNGQRVDKSIDKDTENRVTI